VKTVCYSKGGEELKTVCLPVLYRLNPKTLLTQYLQTAEEVGETAKNINLLTGLSAKRKPVPDDIVERTGEELFDALQSLIGCLAVLERDLAKMRERGYLSSE
jgi:NTP pyrophosphatase (non-canonical NTP hydrolase)